MSKNKTSNQKENTGVIDPKDMIWKNIENLTKGMNPSERAKYLIEFVESIHKNKSNTSTKKIATND